MHIAIGSDSFGYALKLPVVRGLTENGHTVTDVGTPSDVPDETLCDRADAVCAMVTSGKAERGVLICGTGAAMVIRANRWPGIRAVVCRSAEDATEARANANMNIMVLQGFHMPAQAAQKAVSAYLQGAFEPLPRRVNRMARLDAPLPEAAR